LMFLYNCNIDAPIEHAAIVAFEKSNVKITT